MRLFQDRFSIYKKAGEPLYKRLVNSKGFIFDAPGSGKFFFAKMEMGNMFLNTDDDIIVIDPQHEYLGIAEKGGVHAGYL